MKRLLACGLVVGAFVGGLHAEGDLPGKSGKKQAPVPVVAVYDLEGVVSEAGAAETSLVAGLKMDGQRPMTFLDLCRSMDAASRDAKVTGVVIDADGAQLDLAQIQEIRRRATALRQAGKEVWMYSESFGIGTALLGSAASHFTLMPEAHCALDGIHVESMYFKTLLDRIGVAAEVVHIGDYKSFGEQFHRTGPSDAARRQDESLVDEVFNQVVDDLSASRNLARRNVLELIDLGSQRPQQVVSAGLADALASRTDFIREVRAKFGENADYDHTYAMPDLNGPEINGFMDVFKLMLSNEESVIPRKDFIAVVPLEGEITDDSVRPLREWILKLAKEKKARALVLRVNSPGGSALASEVLWEATDEWKSTGKPFVVSMGGTAASGGYYASCAADRIFAEQGTLTGSIGVVGMKVVFGAALEQLGISTHVIQRGRFSGLDSFSRAYSDDEIRVVRDAMNAVYDTFKIRVRDGRGAALRQELESLAGGRVFSGKQAVEVGLVDETGGLAEALAWVAKQSGLEKPVVRMFPTPKSAVEGMFAPEEQPDEDFIIRSGRATPQTGSIERVLLAAASTEALPPQALASLRQLASRLQRGASSQILMLSRDLAIPLWTR